MNFYKKSVLILLAYTGILFFSCNKLIDPSFKQSAYPKDIEKILVNKCATAGCHNDQSAINAAGLNLSSFAKLFEGGGSGAVVIPFSPNQSSLMQFINTYADLGLQATPTMPLNGTVLSRDEVTTVKNWITSGCPDIEGNIPFSSNADSRTKAYISNQGCDLVSVVDAETGLVMRYVKVGKLENASEVPHNIRVSPDRKYWYVCFIDGSYIQQFDAATDKLVDTYEIGSGLWNIVKISSDGKKAFASSLESNGKLVEVNLETKALKKYDGLFVNPHGIALTKNSDTIYITAQNGNMIYRLIPSLVDVQSISLQKGVPPVTTQGILDPHEIMMNESYSKYFITCQTSNEVRVMQAGVDTLLKVIPVGATPLEMTMSKNKDLLFVTCQEDANPNLLSKGSVYVIDMNTLAVVKIIKEKFFQPHGLAVDEQRNLLYVASRNVAPGGPAPHHTSACNGNNGFFHIIDINTWQLHRPGTELSVDPYSVDFR